MMCIITRYFNTLREAMINEELTQTGLYLQGKFEGQAPLAKAFHNQYLDVGAKAEAGSIAEDGVHLCGWTMEYHEMHQLNVKRYVILAEHKERFILEQYDTEADYHTRMNQIHEADYHRDLTHVRLEHHTMLG